MRSAKHWVSLCLVVAGALSACAGDGESPSGAVGTSGAPSGGGVTQNTSGAGPAVTQAGGGTTAAGDGATETAGGTAGSGAGSSPGGAATSGASAVAGSPAGGTPALGGGPGGGGASGAPGSGGQAQSGSGGDANAAGGVGGAVGGGGLGGAGQAGGASGAGGSDAGDGGSGGSGNDEPVDQSALPDVTLHLAGDSTVMTYDAGSAQEGWGQELGQFFIDKVRINNQAIGGASIRTFQTGRWTNIMSALSSGDYVMIQFGTNDSGTVQGRHVDVLDFAAALNEMVDDVESKQATAIFVTPSALQEWSGDTEGNTRLGPYADAMREVGPMRDVLVDDLNARGVELLNMIGQTAAQEIYIDGDKAHFTKQGAIQMAQFVAEELERIDSPLSAYLNP